MRKAVPEQEAHVVDMKTKPDLYCTWALLEWRVNLPVGFQKDVVSLAEGLNAQVILLLSA